MSQISLNLTDMSVTPMHVAYEEARREARQLGVAVTGSELVKLLSSPLFFLFLLSSPLLS